MIVSSTILSDVVQRDLRRAVVEAHTNDRGAVQHIHYLADANVDVVLAMSERVPRLEQQAADAELANDVAYISTGQYARVTEHDVTLTALRAALRALYQTASGDMVGRIAGFLLTLTDAQLRVLFGLTTAQVSALRTRLQAKVDVLSAVLSAVGE